ncbi:YxeA family protein [Levilactobacillus brevis]|uniref:YxeA family protein n=1 Tax=Levilactobacillus brevis TaxID=1580 RepID=UPI001CDAE704|nr:YxeA family protein [Levilactobacillus brevis]
MFWLPQFTKNKHSELVMALDNVNPVVKPETVYALTTTKPVRQFTGGAGEKEYTYRLTTYNDRGQTRIVMFDAQWRLKPQRFLKIKTKGQNVESWTATARQEVPSGVRQNLLMS